MDNGSKVYQAINKVQADLAKEGISKDRKNLQQNYSFRGIDDVYNALSPLLAQHQLCILPRILSREVIERKSNSGGALFYVTVDAEFDFVSAEDGSRHVVKTFGEAMDSGDKATNKAMSAAYKYACFQAFAIPTEGDNDADLTTHTVKPAAAPTLPYPSDPNQKLIPTPKGPKINSVKLGLAIMEYCNGDTKYAQDVLKKICGKTTCSGMMPAEATEAYAKFLAYRAEIEAAMSDTIPPDDDLPNFDPSAYDPQGNAIKS